MKTTDNLLNRRIVYPGIKFNGEDIQDCVELLLERNIINPKDPGRKIDNVVFERNPNLPRFEVFAQYKGEDLCDAIVELCNMAGFELTIERDYLTNQIIFRLYYGGGLIGD